MPIYPASAEHAAPHRKHMAVSGLRKYAIRPAIITTKTARIEYSLLRNAMAPAYILLEIELIASVPLSCDIILAVLIAANKRAVTPAIIPINIDFASFK